MDTFFLNELKMCCAEINSDTENEMGFQEWLMPAREQYIF